MASNKVYLANHLQFALSPTINLKTCNPTYLLQPRLQYELDIYVHNQNKLETLHVLHIPYNFAHALHTLVGEQCPNFWMTMTQKLILFSFHWMWFSRAFTFVHIFLTDNLFPFICADSPRIILLCATEHRTNKPHYMRMHHSAASSFLKLVWHLVNKSMEGSYGARDRFRGRQQRIYKNSIAQQSLLLLFIPTESDKSITYKSFTASWKFWMLLATDNCKM